MKKHPPFTAYFTVKVGALFRLQKDQIRRFFNLKLLVTTNTLLKAIAAAASMGLSSPAAAAGMRMML